MAREQDERGFDDQHSVTDVSGDNAGPRYRLVDMSSTSARR
jgi:hypothetical protein